MALNELRHRAQSLLRHCQETVATKLLSKPGIGGSGIGSGGGGVTDAHHPQTTMTRRLGQYRRRYRRNNANSNNNNNQNFRPTTGPLDVARFALVSIATLPFSLWVAVYSFSYYNRIQHCRDALSSREKQYLEDDDNDNDDGIRFGEADKKSSGGTITSSSSSSSFNSKLIGREDQLAQVQALLQNPRPHQIIVVAGPNESGKSRFVSELIRCIHSSSGTTDDDDDIIYDNKNSIQGVTYIQLAQTIVDSISTLTRAFVDAFDLQWLQLRHALVDVLPFAGSEILVMKERYSDRDFVQGLAVITKALEELKVQADQTGCRRRPVIVVDGLGEGGGSRWIRQSPEGRRSLQRLLKWCIYVTKERGLAHIILTGNEELVISLTDQNRMTRGHVKVIGLGDLDTPTPLSSNTTGGKNHTAIDTNMAASRIIRQEWPSATPSEIRKITDTFGGFIHDLHDTSRQIQYALNAVQVNDDASSNHVLSYKEKKARRAQIIDQVLSARFRLQVERVTAAFAKGKDDTIDDDNDTDEVNDDDDDEDELDPYLDPLKEVYSEAQASQNDEVDENDESPSYSSSSSSSSNRNAASWSQLQLWHTLQRLVDSAEDTNMRVPFADLRDDVFHGDMTPLLDLMNEDVLGFEVMDYSSSRSSSGGVDGVGSSGSGGASSSPATATGSGVVRSGVGGGWSWHVKPATPALGRVFQYLVNDSSLKERFLEIQKVAQRNEKLEENENDRKALRRERMRLDMRKDSLLKTVELGKVLDREELIRNNIGDIYKTIIEEEIAIEKRGMQLRKKRESLLRPPSSSFSENSETTDDAIMDVGMMPINESSSSGKTTKSSLPFSDHATIQQQLSAAILHTSGAKEDKERLFGFRERFEELSKSNNGITAADVVRLIKKSTGEELDLETANSFIRACDANDDDHLDYDEFVEMLLTNSKLSRSRRSKAKR